MKEGLQTFVYSIGDNGTFNTLSEEELKVFQIEGLSWLGSVSSSVRLDGG